METERWQGHNGTVQPSEPQPPAHQQGKSNKLVGQWIATAEPHFAPLFFHLPLSLHMPKSKCGEEEGVGGEMGMQLKFRWK